MSGQDDSGRIAKRFAALKSAGRGGLITFVTAGDPDPVTAEADGSTEFKRIRVSVVWTGGRGGELILTTLRTKI